MRKRLYLFMSSVNIVYMSLWPYRLVSSLLPLIMMLFLLNYGTFRVKNTLGRVHLVIDRLQTQISCDFWIENDSQQARCPFDLHSYPPVDVQQAAHPQSDSIDGVLTLRRSLLSSGGFCCSVALPVRRVFVPGVPLPAIQRTILKVTHPCLQTVWDTRESNGGFRLLQSSGTCFLLLKSTMHTRLSQTHTHCCSISS